MKRKKVPPAVPSASCLRLAAGYRNWLALWRDSVTDFCGKSLQSGWWTVAAEACVRYDIPEDLMLYTVFRYVNSNPEEPLMEFRPTIFRSQHALDRSVRNFRDDLSCMLRPMADLYFVCNNEAYYPPKSTLAYARDMAALSVGFFRRMLESRRFAVEQTTGQSLPDHAMDTIAYSLCDKNPFLLLAVAGGGNLRALAAANAWKLVSWQPWNACVWEGLASEGSLLNLGALCDKATSERYYGTASPKYGWPPFVAESADLSFREAVPRPMLPLAPTRACPATVFFLQAERSRLTKSGQPR